MARWRAGYQREAGCVVVVLTQSQRYYCARVEVVKEQKALSGNVGVTGTILPVGWPVETHLVDQREQSTAAMVRQHLSKAWV
jgi:hypothetical protein